MEDSCCSQPHLLGSGGRPTQAGEQPLFISERVSSTIWGEMGKRNHSFSLSAGELNVKFGLNKPCNETSQIPINRNHSCNQEG